jgi:hypothetical protein
MPADGLSSQRPLMRAMSVDYTSTMVSHQIQSRRGGFASIPSPRTLHAEMLRLCARIGYSPPFYR